jgi:hypothetical protein
LKPRRRFAKSPAYKSPAKTTDREEIPQPKDYRFAIGETVIIYFDERAKRIIGVLPWKNAKSPLSKVSTYGKITQASSDKAIVAFTRPSGSFSARLKSDTPMSVDGGFPLFALLNSNFVATDVERFDTKSTRSVGEAVKVYFDPISGKAVEEPTIYSVMGKIVKPGVVEVPKVVIKTVVVKGNVPKGKRIEVFLDDGKVSLKRISDKSVRVPGTVVDSKDGVSTVSYMEPRKNDGQYVKRYSPTNITGQFVSDPRFVRRLSPDQQRAIAMYKPPVPPVCVGETFNPRSSDNCFVKGVEQRLAPIIAEKRKFKGTAGANPQCDFSIPKIGAHQMAVYEFARILASRSPKEIGGIRGMLCFHSVGSGKTATSLGVALAFWGTKRNIVLATTPENNRDNNAHVYTENLFKFYPDHVKLVFKDTPLPEFTRAPFGRQVSAFGSTMSAGDALKRWCADKKNVGPMSRRIKTFSFTELASNLGFQGTGGVGRANPEGEALLMGKYGKQTKKEPSKLIGSVLIMDEVQSLFKPSGTSEDYIKAANWLRAELTNAKYKKHMYVFALTGTPGGTVNDILSVVNFVRPLNVPRIRPEDLNKHPEWLKGFVSYVELRGDTSVYGNKNVQNVFSEMDPKYYAGFLKTIKTLTDTQLKAEKRPGYMKNAIGAGDALTTKTAITGLYSADEIERLSRRDLTGGIPAVIRFGPKMSILSPKLREVLKRVLSTPGKQYMYVINASTAFTIMAVLDSMGYSNYVPSASPLGSGKRYAFYKSGSYSYKGKTVKIEAKQLNAMKKALAASSNINGDNIKIVLATGTYYQGLDTPGLTGVHIVDPLHDVAADIQAVGRALRMCGHSKSSGKLASIYRYFSTVPRTFTHDGISKKLLPDLERTAKKILNLNLSADLSTVNGPPPGGKLPPGINSYVFADAVRRNAPVAQTERLLKAMAVDCKIFKDVFHSKENFQCGKPVFVDVASSAQAVRSPTAARSPTTGLIQLSPLTPRSSPKSSPKSSKSSSPRRSSSPSRMSGKAAPRYSSTGRERFGSASRRSPSQVARRRGSAMARFDLPNTDPRLRKEFKRESSRAESEKRESSRAESGKRESSRAESGKRESPVKAVPGKARSPFTNTEKVNSKKRQVLRDSKGRTYVRQGDKKVYVKKLFTPQK